MRNKLVLLALALSASPVFAAVPDGFADAMTGLQTDAIAMAGVVAPVVIAILAAGVGLRLIKRFGSKV